MQTMQKSASTVNNRETNLPTPLIRELYPYRESGLGFLRDFMSHGAPVARIDP